MFQLEPGIVGDRNVARIIHRPPDIQGDQLFLNRIDSCGQVQFDMTAFDDDRLWNGTAKQPVDECPLRKWKFFDPRALGSLELCAGRDANLVSGDCVEFCALAW